MTQKSPTDWSGNPAAEANFYVYDSALKTYDSTMDTYDGIVTTNLLDTEKLPVAWSGL